MKKLFSIIALLCATSALAAPKAGDYLKLAGTVSQSGVTVPATLEMMNVSCNSAACVVRETITIGGNVQSADSTVALEEMTSEEVGAQIVSGCVSYGYTLDTVAFAGGSMQACKISQPGQTLWIAAVPFGVVKIQGMVDQAGTTADVTISEVKRGL